MSDKVWQRLHVKPAVKDSSQTENSLMLQSFLDNLILQLA